MRKLGSIVARLTAARRATAGHSAGASDPVLRPLRDFGPNPGRLTAHSFVPPDLKPGAPPVVILHGCTQNAELYDRGSGWSQLAARDGFALLYPEQTRANNSNLCFNWFQPSDARRGQGETRSISQMIAAMVDRHQLDPARVFITGLSAGGAMTSVMLATYPELFAGGAVIAGLPFGCARSLGEALGQMRGSDSAMRRILERRARAAADHSGRMPSLSVWHGTSDSIVDPSNAGALIDQWRDLYGMGGATGMVEPVGRHRREVWSDASGRAMIERYDIRGMGHGVPLASGGPDPVGAPGPHMLEAGISSTNRIAQFWGISEAGRTELNPVPKARSAVDIIHPVPFARPAVESPGVAIERALRAAGLMR